MALSIAPDPNMPHMTDERATRRFVSPSGRTWMVRLFSLPCPPRETQQGSSEDVHVLRFESDGVTLDLVDWPHDWLERSDDQLVALARNAQPPTYGVPQARRA